MADELTNTASPEAAETQPVTEETVYESAPKRKKPIIIGLVSAVLVVIIGGGIVLYLRGNIALPGRPTPLPKVMEKIKNGQAKCDGAKDSAKCLSELTLDEAVSGKQAAACEKIADAELKDGCFDTVARELKDAKICEDISFEAARDECAGAIFLNKTGSDLNTELCSKIISEKWQDICYRRVFIEKSSLEYCGTVTEKRDLCISIAAYGEATTKGDPALCAPIADAEVKASCEEDVNNLRGSLDSDNDGLTSAQEAQYGTDPNNPDTDGDGFKDGDEVSAGYNPKGAGRLP